jgi:hypothetical protein
VSSIAPKVELSYKHHIYYNTTNQREEIYGKGEENEEQSVWIWGSSVLEEMGMKEYL